MKAPEHSTPELAPAPESTAESLATPSSIRTLHQREIDLAHDHAWAYFLQIQQQLHLPNPTATFNVVNYYAQGANIFCTFNVETTPRMFIHVRGTSLQNPEISHE